MQGILKASAVDVVFRDPGSFIAGNVHNHYKTWEIILKGYHKQEEVLGYIANGVSISSFFKPFKGTFKGKPYNSETPPKMILENSKSCIAFEEFISSSILERVNNGSMSVWGKEGFCTPPHLVMPITIEPTKPRMCHDERFLNLWMRCPPVKFDPITDLPRYVDQSHFQTKLDDKSGYDHIRLTANSRKFFGLCWKGWYFVYNTIPFGWSPSAYIYHTTGLGVSHFIRSKGVPLSQYIDDRHVGQLHLPARKAIEWSDFELAEAAVFIASLVLVHCGYFIGIQKSVLKPTQNILFLGFICSSTDQSFSLPADKRQKFAELRESILKSNTVTVKTLQRFAGKANSFCLAVPAAKLYTREVNVSISKGMKSSKPLIVSDNLKKEVQEWRFLDTWKGSMPWKTEKHFSVQICSDASNSGWGGILTLPQNKMTTRDYWSPEEASLPIAIREAKALFNTLRVFSRNIFNARIDAYIDNSNLLHFWNNEGGRSIPLTNEIKDLFHLCLQLNISLNLHYTPSSSLPADAPSRYSSDIDCCLSDLAWEKVERVYGPHTVDLMAIPSNVRKDRHEKPLKFFAPYPCVGSSGSNVFAQDISLHENAYTFPPFTLVGPLLKFLATSGCRVSIVVPDISPRRYWWPVLTATSVDRLLLGKKGEREILFFPPTKTHGWQTKPLQWDLYVFRIIF